jgi:hypothetical protein
MSLPNCTKYLKIPFLISLSEMESLFQTLGNFEIALLGKIVPSCQWSHEKFLAHYATYLQGLQKGEVPARLNTFVWSSCGGIEAQSFSDKGELTRPQKPMLLLQPSHVKYEKEAGVFKPISFGSDLFSWGFQLSYPTLYQDPVTGKIEKVLEEKKFGNTLLFKSFQKWIRLHTKPTPFVVNNEKINVPIRLGKECFSWIEHHAQLKERNLHVSLH